MHGAEVLFQSDADLICVLRGTDRKTASDLPKGLIGQKIKCSSWRFKIIPFSDAWGSVLPGSHIYLNTV